MAGIFALLCIGSEAFAAANLSARLDRDVVNLGESVTFTLIFEDLAPPGAPTLPQIPDVAVTGVSKSSEITINNGQQSSRQLYAYTLVPAKVGEITIPAIQAQTQGKIFSTQPLKLRVVQASARPGATDPTISQMAFLQFQPAKSEVYVGEALPVDITLYAVALQEPHWPQFQAEGFTVGKMVQGAQTRTIRDGKMYSVWVIKTYVSPIRPGQLSLGPVTMSVSIPASARRSFFGDLIDWRQVNLTAEPQNINVLPLPTVNVPPDFNGTVGSYNLSMTAGPTNLAVGDPITLKVQITGRGVLESLNLPSQQHWRDFKTYPATSKFDSKDPLGLVGIKSFEQVVIPQNHEIRTLPTFSFSFFDPDQKSYRTLSSPAVALAVRASASAVVPVLTNTTSGTPPPPQVNDIVHIKARLENIALATPPLIERPAFLAWQAIPVLAWLALLVARQRREALANNPRLRRQRQVAQRVREGLKQLHLQAEQQEAEQFFATLFRLLQEQLGERLNLPATAITEAVIEEHLRGRDLEPETLDSLHELFKTCNQFRYAPMKTRQELSSLIPKLEPVLEKLRAWKGIA